MTLAIIEAIRKSTDPAELWRIRNVAPHLMDVPEIRVEWEQRERELREKRNA